MKLGNQLGFNAYANLRGPFVARRDIPILPKNPRAAEREIYKARVEAPCKQTWLNVDIVDNYFVDFRKQDWRALPLMLQEERRTGKRMVSENTNTLSHVDTLIWGSDIDKSDGLLKQCDSEIYRGAAGLNAKAERTPIYGYIPPVAYRTFGPEGPVRFQ
ncbi:unnamed protein product [Symbiodinium pilosum]|uniref:Uncharacterized protein n=1 Tax=Symbiodinium pilosum TaxID=2952 RepID=A0A812K212_SYMPI|nr:unnamed protein product [Symbiodinium pilosum]